MAFSRGRVKQSYIRENVNMRRWYFAAAATLIVLLVIIWVWPAPFISKLVSESNSSREDHDGLETQSVKDVPIIEKRFSMVFRPSFGTDTEGSITLEATGDGYMLLSCERPGDKMMMSLGGLFGGGGTSETTIGIGEGSEVRFVGTFSTSFGSVTGDEGSRLVFRKADGDWAYICGRGRYEEDSIITELGKSRSVESCLQLLNNNDPILREGGARDLGRLGYSGNVARVVPKLAGLLRDSSSYVRRGAIEGLGLIGTAEAKETLQAAYMEEVDSLTIEYLEEALGFCAAYSIMRVSGASEQPPEIGLTRLSAKEELGDWVTDNLVQRMADHRQSTLAILEEAISSTDLKIAQAARQIKKALLAFEGQ